MEKIVKICPICSIEFSIPFCHRDRYLTCGRKCGGIIRTKPIVTNTCKQCSKEFISKKAPKRAQNFCSRLCSLQSRSNKIERTCIECTEIFYVIPSRISKIQTRAKFCSRICQLTHWEKRSLKNQRPGCYRRNAWRTFEKKCEDCGYCTHPEILLIHHIDGDRSNGKLENLVPLCQNCHCLRHFKKTGNTKVPSARKKKNIS